MPVEIWLEVFLLATLPAVWGFEVIEEEEHRHQKFHGPRDLSIAAEKERRKLRLVCSSWKNIADRIGPSFVDEPVRGDKNTLLLPTSHYTVAAVFNQYAVARHANIVVPFRELFEDSPSLSVLDLKLQLPVAIQFLRLCAHRRPIANQLRSLFLEIYYGHIPISSTPIGPPLAILSNISSAFPRLLELTIVSDALSNELLGWGNEASTLNLPQLRRLYVNTPNVGMNLDWAAIHAGQAWDLPSLEHLALYIERITVTRGLLPFGPTLQSLSIRYNPITPISTSFWDLFPSLRQLRVRVPFTDSQGEVEILPPLPTHPLLRLVLDPERVLNPEAESRRVALNIVAIAYEFLQCSIWIQWIRYAGRAPNVREVAWNPQDWERFREALLRKGRYTKSWNTYTWIMSWE